MKMIIMTMLLLLAAGSGMTADKPTGKDAGKSAVTTGTQESPGQKTAEKKETVQWPRPYKSTEEVSADSMVPFPTDI